MPKMGSQDLKVYAASASGRRELDTVIRSYSSSPLHVDEENFPARTCRNGIVIAGKAIAPSHSMPVITIDSTYAAFVPITLVDLDVCHDYIALRIDGTCSCTLKIEGRVSLAGSVGIQGGSGTLTLETASGATLRGMGIHGEGFETALSCEPTSSLFPGCLTLTGAGSFEFIASGPFAGIMCPDGTLTLAGSAKLTVSGGCTAPRDFICGPGGPGVYVRNLVVTTTYPDGLASVGGNADLYEGGCGIVAQRITADGKIIACGGEGRVGGDGCWLQAFGDGKITGTGDVILRGGAGTSGSRGCGLWIQNRTRNPIDM